MKNMKIYISSGTYIFTFNLLFVASVWPSILFPGKRHCSIHSHVYITFLSNQLVINMYRQSSHLGQVLADYYITERSVQWYYGFSIATASAASAARRPWRREHSNSKNIQPISSKFYMWVDTRRRYFAVNWGK